MDESGTLPSDPSPGFDTPNREAPPGPDASLPVEETTRVSASHDPALDQEPGAGASVAAGPADTPAEPGAHATPAAPSGAATAKAATARRARAATERKRRAWESHRQQSLKARETFEERLRNAEELAQGTQSAGTVRRADALLNEVRTLLGSDLPGTPGQLLIGPDRRACWDRWRRVRDALKLVRDRQHDQDYQTLGAPVAEATECARSGDPSEAMRRVKDLQGRLSQACLRRGQFEELRQRLSEAWLAAQARITARRQERSQQREEWRTRTKGHLARWRGTLEQRRGQREHLLLQVTKLEGMEKNARSEDFAAQVHGWLQETAEKLRRNGESIAELEERIRATSKKLGGSDGRTRAGRVGTTTTPGPPSPPGEPREEAPPEPPQDDPPEPPEAGS
jgi:hypothetical protein